MGLQLTIFLYSTEYRLKLSATIYLDHRVGHCRRDVETVGHCRKTIFIQPRLKVKVVLLKEELFSRNKKVCDLEDIP